MLVLYRGNLRVDYGQAYVESRTTPGGFTDMATEARAGQANGLCGAAVPGFLFLTTGLHSGDVGFTVELHETEPPVAGGWEDVVEVSFRPDGPRCVLMEQAGTPVHPLPLDRIDYRAPYCASGMDEGAAQDMRWEGEPEIDRYLLQFWPGPPAPDSVVRQASRQAAYWNQHAGTSPAEHERKVTNLPARAVRQPAVRAIRRTRAPRPSGD